MSETPREKNLPISDAEMMDNMQLRESINKLSHIILHQLSNGDLAELRRVDPTEPYSPALWKLLLHDVIATSWYSPVRGRQEVREEREVCWAVILMAMAMTAGLHDPKIPFGKALAEAGWSELRFVRLMRTRGTDLFTEIRRVASFMASKNAKANWAECAALLHEQLGERSETERRRVARSYYQARYAIENS